MKTYLPPLTVHALCVVAQREETCTVCAALPGCDCVSAHAGVHLCRLCAAARDGHVTMADLASVMYDADVFTGRSLLPDPPALTP